MKRRKKPGRKLKLSKRLRIPKLGAEQALFAQGFERIAGLDEVGRGAWAGPLVACAVILPSPPCAPRILKLRDSKLLREKERTLLASTIRRRARGFAYGKVDVAEINTIGMARAIPLAWQRAIEKLSPKPQAILLDGKARWRECPVPCFPIVKGDMSCVSIAAASVLAKVERDRLMRQLAKDYPTYHLEENKGYGTRAHQEALKAVGPAAVHRKGYKSIRRLERKLTVTH